MTEKRKNGIDEVDHKIVRLLSKLPRQTNVALAKKTGLSEITVANRLRRLSERGIARVVGVLDASLGGGSLSVAAFIKVSGRDPRDVALDLGSIEECRGSSVVSGSFDIVTSWSFSDTTHLSNVVENKIGDIIGIEEIELSLFTSIAGFKEMWAKCLTS